MVAEIILLVLEIIGTIAFAISGAYVAIKAKLDVFGVVFIGCITAVGGGMTRDILIGHTPPQIFSNLYVLLVAAVSSLIVFVLAYVYRNRFVGLSQRVEQVVNVFDAIGLGAFSVIGTEIAFVHGVADNAFLAIMLGMLTGVGGGVYRDILTDTTPYIFKKHVYALASIVGACVYYVIRLFVSSILIPSLVGMALVIIIRILATHYRWSLPKAQIDLDYKPIHFFHNKKD